MNKPSVGQQIIKESLTLIIIKIPFYIEIDEILYKLRKKNSISFQI